MAERAAARVNLNDDAIKFTWTPVQQNDTCLAATGLSEFDDRTVHIEGVPSGATIAIQGTASGGGYATLNDTFGSPLSFTTTDKIRAVTEYVDSIKPVLSGGDGSTAWTVTLLCKRKRK